MFSAHRRPRQTIHSPSLTLFQAFCFCPIKAWSVVFSESCSSSYAQIEFAFGECVPSQCPEHCPPPSSLEKDHQQVGYEKGTKVLMAPLMPPPPPPVTSKGKGYSCVVEPRLGPQKVPYCFIYMGLVSDSVIIICLERSKGCEEWQMNISNKGGFF